jgi:hypothetical protein
MKESPKILFVLVIFLILVLSLASVSAGLFNKNRITGEVISPVEENTCMDSDGGLNYYVKGIVRGDISSLGGNSAGLIGQVYDFCIQLDENGLFPWADEQYTTNVWNKYEVQICEENCAIYEMSCKNGKLWTIIPKCPAGCVNGACIEKPKENCTLPLINGNFQDTDGDGCNTGTDSDCGGIEGANGPSITCFDKIDNDCDGMIDSLDDDLSCNLNCGDRICGWYEKTPSSKYYCEKDCIPSDYCTDSDGGLNYYVYGTITGIDKDGEGNPPGDYCWADGKGVMEGYCTPEGYIDFSSYACPNGCKDGACLEKPKENCNAQIVGNQFQDTDGDGCNTGTDSDCGGIEGANGPSITCFDKIDNDCDGMIDSLDDDLSCNLNCGDRICGTYEIRNSSKYYCPDDCNPSECISCTDSDGGLNYYVYGAITGIDKDGEGNPPGDYCWADGNGVMEGYCKPNEYIDFISYACPNGCKDGACVHPNKGCTDSDGGLNYYTRGIINGPGKDRERNPPADYCWKDGTGVMEGYCTPEGYVDFSSYACSNGCKNGACVINLLKGVLNLFR